MNEAKVERGAWSLISGYQQHEVRVDRDGDTWVVSIRGRKMSVTIEDPRAWSASASGKQGAGLARIATPMPGKVVRVLVAAGDQIEAGHGVVVVEAMKMQNEMKSPIAGKVQQVLVADGATVNGNQVLVVVEADAN